jgi:hypothetical protein
MLALLLVCMLVVLMMGGTLTEIVIRQHRRAAQRQQQAQCFWLAETAVQRALSSAAESPEYTGETWRIPAEILGGSDAGQAIIEVQRANTPRDGLRVRVEARFPDQPIGYQVSTRELFVPSASPGGSP